MFLCRECGYGLFPIEGAQCSCCGLPYADEDAAEHLCEGCSKGRRRFDHARAAFIHEGAAREMVIKFKFSGRFNLAPELIRMAFDGFKAGYSSDEFDIVIPVPLHPRRLKQREYNQALLLARELGRLIDVPIDFNTLKRVRWTLPQTGLAGPERRKNVRNAFSVENPGCVKDRRILLIDDVFTTGATVDECARILKKANAGSVDVFTLTRAM